jgi:hypothetical protein
MHCDRPFEKPYNRMPELETTPDVRVLKCSECDLLTVFQSASSFTPPRANIPPFDPPSQKQKDLFTPPSPREPGEE